MSGVVIFCCSQCGKLSDRAVTEAVMSAKDIVRRVREPKDGDQVPSVSEEIMARVLLAKCGES